MWSYWNNAMKYAPKVMKNRNEICPQSYEIMQWNIPTFNEISQLNMPQSNEKSNWDFHPQSNEISQWNIPLLMKKEISQWNKHPKLWYIGMKYAPKVMKYRNEICIQSYEISQWNIPPFNEIRNITMK
jgi:hypothetical protein